MQKPGLHCSRTVTPLLLRFLSNASRATVPALLLRPSAYLRSWLRICVRGYPSQRRAMHSSRTSMHPVSVCGRHAPAPTPPSASCLGRTARHRSSSPSPSSLRRSKRQPALVCEPQQCTHLASTSRPARCLRKPRGSRRSYTAARAGPPTAGPARAKRSVCERCGVAGELTRHGVERSLEKLERRHALARRIRLLALLQRIGRLRRATLQRERGARARPARRCAPALPAQRGLQPRVHVRGAARSRGERGAAASWTAAVARMRTGVPPARVAGAAGLRGMPAARQRQP